MEEKKAQEINNIIDDFDIEVIELDNVKAVPSTAASSGNGWSSTSTCGSSSSSTCSACCS
ncbi:thiazolylpeptide-type bacteriocin [Clostridium manihotivorum]|uniref:Thiazolylpeptide-type bacteriocin n=1 Tax=Clostridium manihotivorum TaxID=2320868 RepID=A0A410DPY3_9CLOT|nr:thiazolylpeptide-type bacteriocin [Clostridium manihotivorum]QAA31106.1 thiazolylpeptide-type bacteriocin [Clostridium manihotivorum]